MTDHPRRFPAPWTIEDKNNACFVVKGATALRSLTSIRDELGQRMVASLMTA